MKGVGHVFTVPNRLAFEHVENVLHKNFTALLCVESQSSHRDDVGEYWFSLLSCNGSQWLVSYAFS